MFKTYQFIILILLSTVILGGVTAETNTEIAERIATENNNELSLPTTEEILKKFFVTEGQRDLLPLAQNEIFYRHHYWFSDHPKDPIFYVNTKNHLSYPFHRYYATPSALGRILYTEGFYDLIFDTGSALISNDKLTTFTTEQAAVIMDFHTQLRIASNSSWFMIPKTDKKNLYSRPYMKVHKLFQNSDEYLQIIENIILSLQKYFNYFNVPTNTIKHFSVSYDKGYFPYSSKEINGELVAKIEYNNGRYTVTNLQGVIDVTEVMSQHYLQQQLFLLQPENIELLREYLFVNLPQILGHNLLNTHLLKGTGIQSKIEHWNLPKYMNELVKKPLRTVRKNRKKLDRIVPPERQLLAPSESGVKIIMGHYDVGDIDHTAAAHSSAIKILKEYYDIVMNTPITRENYLKNGAETLRILTKIFLELDRVTALITALVIPIETEITKIEEAYLESQKNLDLSDTTQKIEVLRQKLLRVKDIRGTFDIDVVTFIDVVKAHLDLMQSTLDQNKIIPMSREHREKLEKSGEIVKHRNTGLREALASSQDNFEMMIDRISNELTLIHSQQVSSGEINLIVNSFLHRLDRLSTQFKFDLVHKNSVKIRDARVISCEKVTLAEQ